MIHTVKGFDAINKAVVEVFLEFSYFFDDPTNVGNLILRLETPMNSMKRHLKRGQQREFRILGDISF